jgi:hyperosmotically inducible periplasmic protein
MKVFAGILAALAPLLLSGCIPLAVGGAVAAGYYVGKDEREPAVIASDTRITAAVRTRLICDKYIDGLSIGVETYEGVVTLRGEVGTSLPREQAERLAGGVDGVKSVRNEIMIVRKSATAGRDD